MKILDRLAAALLVPVALAYVFGIPANEIGAVRALCALGLVYAVVRLALISFEAKRPGDQWAR